jgi:hypothetical protein
LQEKILEYLQEKDIRVLAGKRYLEYLQERDIRKEDYY